jgi:hypothetical protein
VCGKRHEDRFYPTISGVARSVNVYPIEKEKPEDGIVNLAFGLGKHVVDGGISLRFSPKYPKKILQLSNTGLALRDTQKNFLSLDMRKESFTPNVNEAVNIIKDTIDSASKDGTLKHVISTFDYNDNVIRDGYSETGRKIVTFANILKFSRLPLAEIIADALAIGQKEMNNPIEIEFAVSVNNNGNNNENIFYLLQIRPIVGSQESINVDMSSIEKEQTILKSDLALGHGIIDDICDFVYVKSKSFNPAKTMQIADIVGKINDEFIASDNNYILLGPGRWGSSDSWLGIPVRWAQISAARLIIESGLKDYRVDPSQGTHFFQNLTSFEVGYFTINDAIDQGYFDEEYLNKMPAIYEDEFVRHVRFEKPVQILIDGKKGVGAIMKENSHIKLES